VGHRYRRPFPKIRHRLIPKPGERSAPTGATYELSRFEYPAMIGAYLDAGEHELVEIQKRPISITLTA
jgi:hypothetical protein